MEREPDHRVSDREEARRQAHKMNRLVDEGEVKPSELQKMPEEEFDRILTEKFDVRFLQDENIPAEIKERKPGHQAERMFEVLLNETSRQLRLGCTLELASTQMDHKKIDGLLHVKGSQQAVPLQFTIIDDEEEASRKFQRMGRSIIPVVIPKYIFEAYRSQNRTMLQGIVKRAYGQILAGLRERSDLYRQEYELAMRSMLAIATPTK